MKYKRNRTPKPPRNRRRCSENEHALDAYCEDGQHFFGLSNADWCAKCGAMICPEHEHICEPVENTPEPAWIIIQNHGG